MERYSCNISVSDRDLHPHAPQAGVTLVSSPPSHNGGFTPLPHDTTYLESSNLLLDIIRDITEASAVRCVKRAQFPLEGHLIQNLADAHTAACGLVTVARTDTLTGGADLAATKTGLLQAINDGVQIEADVRAVGDEDALAGGDQTLGLEMGEFLKEAGDVNDGAGADQVDT